MMDWILGRHGLWSWNACDVCWWNKTIANLIQMIKWSKMIELDLVRKTKLNSMTLYLIGAKGLDWLIHVPWRGTCEVGQSVFITPAVAACYVYHHHGPLLAQTVTCLSLDMAKPPPFRPIIVTKATEADKWAALVLWGGESTDTGTHFQHNLLLSVIKMKHVCTSFIDDVDRVQVKVAALLRIRESCSWKHYPSSERYAHCGVASAWLFIGKGSLASPRSFLWYEAGTVQELRVRM